MCTMFMRIPPKFASLFEKRLYNLYLLQGQITLTFEMNSEDDVNLALERCQAAGPYCASDIGFDQPNTILKSKFV